MIPIDTLCESAKLRLIANALGLQQCTRTAACIIPIPGTDNVIAIGPRAWIAKNVPGVEVMVAGPTNERAIAEEIMSNLDGRNGVLSDIDDDLLDEIRDEIAATIATRLAATTQASTAQAEPGSTPVGYVERAQLEWLSRNRRDEASIQLWAGKAPIDAVAVYLTATSSTDAQAAPTDISRRLREAVESGLLGVMADRRMLLAAAEEIERYYGGMMAWKRTAEAKDAGAQAAAEVRPVWIGIDYSTDYLAEVRDAALEEAAQIVDAAHREQHWSSWHLFKPVCDAIRALKRAGDTGEQADGGAAQ